jgi:PAS domain S-box-containing protein
MVSSCSGSGRQFKEQDMIKDCEPEPEPQIPDAPGKAGECSAKAAFLQGGGEMGERICAFDWSKTPLGPIETWSPALRMMTRVLLVNRFPLLLWWGPRYVSIYNDAYRPVLGTKHPWALGQPVSECWKEIWHILQPLIDTPFHGGPATWNDDICLEINRHGFVEETHFTIAYSPVPDETVPSGIGGVLATVNEITGKVVGDRRVEVLRDLGAQSAKAKTAEEACAIAAATLAPHSKDIPFALLYLIEPDRKTARLAGTAGVTTSNQITASLALERDEAGASPWPLVKAMRSEAMETVTDLSFRLKGPVPPSPWTDPPHTAVVVPIHSNKAHYLAGFLVAGVSPRLRLDDSYRDFLTLVSSQLATSIANAREYEEEKRRAEALAEIDQAKTAFFSNVSHEFRTPLALMLGPIEDLLWRSHTELPPAAKDQLEVTHRNSLRLLRLVNTLLDFSRIEVGRMQAVFEPTDLAAFTGELASVFSAATERAGLRLTVDCPSLGEPVYVDREMWEKIVLNLVSNAFKFTFEGEIAVTLRTVDGAAELRVRDTGVGIPAEEMPRLFERFHRVPNVRSRTHEGSGIGLALVQELAKLHGGSVGVESRLNEGSTFIVSVPLGKAHLPPEHVGSTRTMASTAVGAAPFVEEALRWLPDHASAEDSESLPREEFLPVPCPTNVADTSLPRLLVADDNADMRQYLGRLLGECYQVQTVPDGQAALAAARDRQPELILSDIMMPRLDGIGLLRELRADPALRTVPVILLSARAGEESRVEGLHEGADDYLIKPFSARELLARVAAHLDLARLRKQSEEAIRKSEEKYRNLFANMAEQVHFWQLVRDEAGNIQTWRLVDANPPALKSWGVASIEEIRGKTADEIFPGATTHFRPIVTKIFAEGAPHSWESYFAPLDQYLRMTSVPFGEFFITTGADITAMKKAEIDLRESEERLRFVADSAQVGYWHWEIVSDRLEWSRLCKQLFGIPPEEPMSYARFLAALHPDDRARTDRAVRRCLESAGQTDYDVEYRTLWPDGTVHWIHAKGNAVFADGRPVRMAGIALDITERKQSEEALRETQKLESIGLLAGGIAHDFNNLLTGVIGNANLVQEMLAPNDPASEMVQVIVKAGERLAHLTQQLLAYSGKGQFFVEVLDVSATVRDIGDLVRPSIPRKVALHFDLGEDLPPIEADRGQVQQILMNLVINAAEAIGNSGGLVNVATRARVVDDRYIRMHPEAADLPHGEYVVLEVHDTGCGMDETVKSKMFDPFFSTKFAGRGLGLAAVHGIVRGHNGAIFVCSEPGKGSTFTVLFPATGRKARRTQAVIPTEVAQGSGVVLVIDDEEVVREMAKNALERDGYTVLLAYSGLEAIDIIRRHAGNIDVAVLDLSMPGISGEETLPELRKIQPDVKVLVSSGYSEAETMARFCGQEVSGFVQKPYTAPVLVQKVKSAMRGAALPQAPSKDYSGS